MRNYSKAQLEERNQELVQICDKQTEVIDDMLAALNVISLSAATQHWLAVNDPKALQQVRRAINNGKALA